MVDIQKLTPRSYRNDMEQKPNLLVRLIREPQWSQQHPEIMGPNTSFMYFGPGKSSGYLIYGNGPNQPMNSSVRQKKGAAKYALFLSSYQLVLPHCLTTATPPHPPLCFL